MSLNSARFVKRFDKRLVERNLRRGEITGEDLEAHLQGLEDNKSIAVIGRDRTEFGVQPVEEEDDDDYEEEDEEDEEEEDEEEDD